MQYSIVNYNDLEIESMRLDSEFYKLSFLKNNSLLERKKAISLAKLTEKIDVGYVGSMVSEYADSGINLLQTQNIDEFFIKIDGCKKINLSFHHKLKKSQIHYEDILIARSGSYGKASLYLEKDIINSADIIIVKSKKCLNPYYLCSFLNSRFGVEQLLRFASGGIQGHVNLTILGSLKIPLLDKGFQNYIENTVSEAYKKRKLSKSLYAEAENLLFSELGIKIWESQHKLTFTKNLSDAMKIKRIDAEFFQPKYDEVEKAVINYKNGCKSLNKAVVDYSTGFPFKSNTYLEKGIPLIRINNIKDGDLELSNVVFLSEESILLSPKNLAKENDILISMSGTIGSSCRIPKNARYLINQRILRITPKNYDSNVLSLFINSIFGVLQLERIGTGGMQTNISAQDILNIKIPIFSAKKQKEISKIIKNSRKANEESEHILKKVKKSVEIAIEENEKTAKGWLEKQLGFF